jgi:hypothetical protein
MSWPLADGQADELATGRLADELVTGRLVDERASGGQVGGEPAGGPALQQAVDVANGSTVA